MYLESGYKTISGVQLINALALLAIGRLSYRAFRVYLASFETVAIREAAQRTRQKKRGRAATPSVCYRPVELARLCAITEGKVRRDLRTLEREHLLFFSEGRIQHLADALPEGAHLLTLVRSPTRPVPVPRALLRFLARQEKRSIATVMLAYMLRGLTIGRRGGVVSSKGSAKLSWIAAVAGLCERAAAYARKELIQCGWLSPDVGSKQWKLNRHGAYFEINVAWRQAELSIAPQPASKTAAFAPPIEDRKTPYGSKNQKTLGPGFSKKEQGEGDPSIKNVKNTDLFSLSSCEALYWQAVELGLISNSDHAALSFLSAAVRARSVTVGDPARIFVSIIRRGLWRHVTFSQEEVARRGLKKARDQNPAAFRSRSHDGVGSREAA